LRFGVSESSAIRWARRKRKTGSAAAAKMGGKRPKLLEAERAWLMQRMAEKPDLTLSALLVELRDKDNGKGKRVCLDTLWRFLKGCGLSFKKNHLRHRTGPARRRQTALLVAQVPDAH
jgi:transposase